MREDPGDTTHIDSLLRSLETGGEPAVSALIAATSERLTHIARKKLAGFPVVRTQAETGDVLQEALMKLDRAVRATPPSAPREYLGLAALQIERVLLDFARRYSGRVPAELPEEPMARGTTENLSTEDWASFHEAVDRLPDPPRNIFRLHFYLGLTHDQIASQVKQSRKTVGQQIRNAKLLLAKCLGSKESDARIS